ncbi:PREDICTED: uncharacterized protein LOC107342572 isoform X2 [Acropora digitifera]|uniref:uncharacterized protein LOC107342572 isoform X2 n=1 Tax=Acropora digitifera TaxID=70779 RepID=UPI00077A4472|nr:PREDICTED: uncharacterized protein LOC107342572 isoform X2 [Acropora digitifera]
MKVFLKILPVTLLAEVVCSHFCTKGTLDCGNAVPAITKLGSHSCACDNEMHSGALKFDKGNLYVCLEKKWKPVKLISSALKSSKDYGFHQENPGRSCKDILARAGEKKLENGIYWIRIKESSFLLGSETFRVYCDMETEKGGWTMVFKLNGRRNTENTLKYAQLYQESIAFEEDNENALSTKRNDDISGYKSRIMIAQVFPEFNASKAKIVLYKDDESLQKDILFNATSSNAATWFWHSKLTTSSWDDLKKTQFTGHDPKSVFSTRVDQNKLFVIGKKEIKEKCDLKEGWLKVLDHGGRCANFPIKETPGIYYSKKKTATLWSKAEGVGEADVLAVFLQ